MCLEMERRLANTEWIMVHKITFNLQCESKCHCADIYIVTLVLFSVLGFCRLLDGSVF